jgi:hypothetical protein
MMGGLWTIPTHRQSLGHLGSSFVFRDFPDWGLKSAIALGVRGLKYHICERALSFKYILILLTLLISNYIETVVR